MHHYRHSFVMMFLANFCGRKEINDWGMPCVVGPHHSVLFYGDDNEGAMVLELQACRSHDPHDS